MSDTGDEPYPEANRPTGRPLAGPTIARGALGRGSAQRRGWRLRQRAAQLWAAAAAPSQTSDRGETKVALSAGARRALAQIFAADPLAAALRTSSPGGTEAQVPEPLRRVAEERAAYEASPNPPGGEQDGDDQR